MKVRTDYVTNSSSSSFVVAFKKFPEIDAETIEKYPFLSAFNETMKELIMSSDKWTETTDGIVIENDKELKDYIREEYGYNQSGYNQSFNEVVKEDPYARDLYDMCRPKLDEGYKILMKDIGYGDFRETIFKKLESDDFVILEGEW